MQQMTNKIIQQKGKGKGLSGEHLILGSWCAPCSLSKYLQDLMEIYYYLVPVFTFLNNHWYKWTGNHECKT